MENISKPQYRGVFFQVFYDSLAGLSDPISNNLLLWVDLHACLSRRLLPSVQASLQVSEWIYTNTIRGFTQQI